jgi:hypothetical protein
MTATFDPLACMSKMHGIRDCLNHFKQDVRTSFEMWSEDIGSLGETLLQLLDKQSMRRELVVAQVQREKQVRKHAQDQLQKINVALEKEFSENIKLKETVTSR